MATTSAKANKISKNDYDTSRCLPDDLTLEIIIRLPGKSLGRFKLVSKSWNSMISNPNFVKSHIEFSKLNRISKPSLIMGLVVEENLPSVTIDVDCNNFLNFISLAKSIPSAHDISCDPDYFVILGSYNGLFCIHFLATRKLHLLNPSTHERAEVDLPNGNRLNCIHEGSWFGFIPAINDYKVILFASYYPERFLTTHHYMYVYSFRDAKWRELDTTGHDRSYVEGARSPVLLSEALHWTSTSDTYMTSEDHMVRFDLVKETFKRIPLTKDVRGNIRSCLDKEYRYPSLAILENTIYWASYLYIHGVNTNELTLWKLEEYGNWDSWKRIHRIKLDAQFIGPKPTFSGFTCSGEIVFISREAKKLVIIDPFYNTTSYEIEHLPFDELCIRISVVNWFESLASPATLLYE